MQVRSRETFDIHERMLAAAAATRRYIEVDGGRRVHLTEAGEGTPVLFLHGSSTSSLSLLPLLEHLDGVRAIVADRPGFGLSDPVRLERRRFRAAACEFVDEVLDALTLETAALAGNSMGGTWALWYALERPHRVRRLVLLGASPTLPGTRAPTPMRAIAAPVIGDLLSRVKTSERM
ncbi:MAG TPA: alpha/beta fold hydrolase, partial [Woeseiaceae bacterium]